MNLQGLRPESLRVIDESLTIAGVLEPAGSQVTACYFGDLLRASSYPSGAASPVELLIEGSAQQGGTYQNSTGPVSIRLLKL
jgi:hypothetical protein